MSAEHATAHLDEPIDRAAATVVRVAAARSWSIVSGASDRHRLVFSKGWTPTSWSGSLTVVLDAVGPGETRLTVEGGRAVSAIDWGRGPDAVGRIFAAAG
jgi:hypothetical protein